MVVRKGEMEIYGAVFEIRAARVEVQRAIPRPGVDGVKDKIMGIAHMPGPLARSGGLSNSSGGFSSVLQSWA